MLIRRVECMLWSHKMLTSVFICIYVVERLYIYRIGWSKREDDNVDEGIEGEKTRVSSDSSIG